MGSLNTCICAHARGPVRSQHRILVGPAPRGLFQRDAGSLYVDRGVHVKKSWSLRRKYFFKKKKTNWKHKSNASICRKAVDTWLINNNFESRFFLDLKKIQSSARQNTPTIKLCTLPLSTPRAQTALDPVTLGAQPKNKPLPLPLNTQGDNTTSCTIQLSRSPAATSEKTWTSRKPNTRRSPLFLPTTCLRPLQR